MPSQAFSLYKESIFNKFFVRDLTTNRIYKTKLTPSAQVGDRFVSKNYYMTFNEFAENNNINLPKQKVLKMFNERVNLVNKIINSKK